MVIFLLSNVGEETKWVMEKKVLGPQGGAAIRFENANHGKYWWRSRHYLALLVHVVLKKDY
jgi:hypothetical protein